ncbi:hypothetical protein [Sphaerisporangium perillae]|uniref:hypothetical protein n=1 Tax=Sphaerisporangium perillae TaxID=2935860 RepID=UPI00200BB5CA|nr:hypothetical protein [Sphaerisporangium perillae]
MSLRLRCENAVRLGAARRIDECLDPAIARFRARSTWLGRAVEKVRNGELP